ncbi:MAG: DUF4167 domain-containing protein [Hyphomicrobiales bacterium]|nr:DUF4167 domain-containing protein [Hyphomicrobiales bacterium]MCP4999353.1 DUF4167 domain-containing protein [Hyphomicrobiales bacterium]
MRSGQQNKRGRGRNNNNNNGRKNGNPLSRSYDSTGPDVKIRGTAQHIADKYGAMARDALSSGDTVMAENYLQHAEHYNRIIASAQAQMQERYQRDERESAEREQQQQPAENTVSGNENADRETVEVTVDGSGPQPVITGTPAEVAIGEDGVAAQPARREANRRRAPLRPRRQRVPAAENTTDGNDTSANGAAAAEREAAPASESTRAAPDGQDNPPEVAATAPDV